MHPLLIGLLLLLLCTAIIVWQYYSVSKRRRRFQTIDPTVIQPLTALIDRIDDTPDNPLGFGYKNSWLAIRTDSPESVLEVLPIENLQRANWKTGNIAAYNGHAFVSPSIENWVFVVSQKLPELGHPPHADQWRELMQLISEKFGEAQYFATHRVSDFNAWALFKNGIELRAFACVADTLVDRGCLTPREVELDYKYFDGNSPEADSEEYWQREDLCYPDEQHVMEIAKHWSLDPSLLGEKKLPNSVGWIGTIRS